MMGKVLTKYKGHSKLKDESSNMHDNEHEGMEKTQVCLSLKIFALKLAGQFSRLSNFPSMESFVAK